MYIHIGGDVMLRARSIVAIFQYPSEELPAYTTNFLRQQKQEEQSILISDEETVKSIVITDDKVYYSPVSSSTLSRRSAMRPGAAFEEIYTNNEK
ncbi:extracellular matrix regulator RemB [Shouchella shacheensis]|uniref:extracellular matrix regulator RemB n=1 Tax=Shouchella shacheensis TaxID=1649580 RepID=UPI00073FC2E8|nr:extracellular matrix/biofilm biosynthesis regulator RemA family protein [Shouchella shacheensis]